MAASDDIAESLTLDDIPVKLRCASCNKLAQDAVRLPCCDQNICADCQANKLETTCPICYHEPINADDCRPNKALRQTIKIFLKKKVIDRENAKKKELREKAASSAAAPTATQANESSTLQAGEQSGASAENGRDASVKAKSVTEAADTSPRATASRDPESTQTAQEDIPRPSIESPVNATIASKTPADDVKDARTGGADETPDQQQTTTPAQATAPNPMASSMNGMALDGSSLANMGFNGMGDMNQMMQMMQSGMANPMMGNFPNMMGMGPMGMDPLAMSQGMFGNFGGSGMMNGMNMGMGFDVGQGTFGGGFDGQPQGAWNSGQNNFNQNSFGSGGDFGANAGYGAGNNMAQHQGSFNQMHQPHYSQNHFHQHGPHNQGFHRGRGRGRGAYPYNARGRGYHNQVNPNFHANSASFEQQDPQEPVRRGSPEYTPMNGAAADDASRHEKRDEPVRDEFEPGDAEDRAEERAASNPDDVQTQDVPSEKVDDSEHIKDTKEESTTGEENSTTLNTEPSAPTVEQKDIQTTLVPIASSDASAMPPPPSPSVPSGPSRRITSEDQGVETGSYQSAVGQDQRGPLHTRGFTRIPNGEISRPTPIRVEKPKIPPPEPQGIGVVGAPTGPKAMRQRFENPAKAEPGFSIMGRASASRFSQEPKKNSPPPSRSRSRSPRKHHSSRQHRSRSASPYEDEDSEKRRERHRHRSRKHQEEFDDQTGLKKPKSSKTRDSSVESSKRNSRRSHRERDYDYDREKVPEKSNHRSHRHREKETNGHAHKSSRHRSRSPENDPQTTGRAHKSTHHHRSHDKEDDYNTSSSSGKHRRSRDEYEADIEEPQPQSRDHRHHHRSKRSKHSSRHPDHEPSSSHQKPPSAPALDERISRPSAPQIPTGPKAQMKADSHALEREKRDRERQFKELQRRALAGGGGGGGGGGAGSSRRPSEGGGASRRQSESDGREGGGGGGGDRGIRINGAAARSGGRKMSVRYEDEFDDLGR